MLPLPHKPCLLQDVSTDVYCSKQPAAVAPKETITHHFFVSGIGQKKLSMQPKICGGAENVVKKQNPANIRKWIARFYYFRYLPAGSACIAHNNCMERSRYGQLYLHCSLIYFWVPSSVFAYDQPLFWGEIIPFSGVCQSGGGCIIHAGGGGLLHWLTDCFDVQPIIDQRQHHHAEYHFQL